MCFINKQHLILNLTDSIIKVNVNMLWSNHDYEIGTETEKRHFNKWLESQ